jgi:hypothetical protein
MPTKAMTAGGTTALAGALTTVILGLFNHPLTPDMQGAITTLISAALTFLATWAVKMEGTP